VARLGAGAVRLPKAAAVKVPVAPQAGARRPTRQSRVDIRPRHQAVLRDVSAGIPVSDALKLADADEPAEDPRRVMPGNRAGHVVDREVRPDRVEVVAR